MIRCGVFNFDGTVVLSNDIKNEGFFATGSPIPEGYSRVAATAKKPETSSLSLRRKSFSRANAL